MIVAPSIAYATLPDPRLEKLGPPSVALALPATLTVSSWIPGTCWTRDQTSRAVGISVSCSRAKVCPVATRPGSMRGVSPETVSSSLTFETLQRDLERRESADRHEDSLARGGRETRGGGGYGVGSGGHLEEAKVPLRVGAGLLRRRRSLECHCAAGDRRPMLVDEPALNISAVRLSGERRGDGQHRRPRTGEPSAWEMSLIESFQ